MTSTSKTSVHAKDRRGIVEGYRSGLEDKISKGLRASGVPFLYEAERIQFTQPEKKRYYTPDFIVTTASGKTLYIEAKGRFVTADRQKQLMVKASNPDLDVRFVFSNPNNRISKTSKTTYAMWCESKGFKYAKFKEDEVIPQEWLEE